MKAEEAVRTVVAVNPAYTSQGCSQCGHRQKMPLSSRRYICPCCHLEINRDVNAAKNIHALGLQSIRLRLKIFVHGLSFFASKGEKHIVDCIDSGSSFLSHDGT